MDKQGLAGAIDPLAIDHDILLGAGVIAEELPTEENMPARAEFTPGLELGKRARLFAVQDQVKALPLSIPAGDRRPAPALE